MVSFIVPVYNGENYIERCLRSIIRNTESDYEIIVIDDGSTDNTLEIIKKVKGESCYVEVYSQKNSGVSSARELGIKRAKGNWIVFVDADDYITSNLVSCINQIKNEEYDWIVFSGQFQKMRTLDMNLPDDKRDVITAILNQSQQSGIRNAKLNAVWSKAYKKCIIDRYGVHFEKRLSHGEDMIFNLDYAKNCRIVYCIPESVYSLCANANSATHKYQKNSVENDREFFIQLNKRESFDSDIALMDSYHRMVLNGIWICLGQYFSHRDNRKKLVVRRKELAEFLNQEPYKTALANCNIEKCRGKKCIFTLLNLHFYGLVLKLFKVVRKSGGKNKIDVKEI